MTMSEFVELEQKLQAYRDVAACALTGTDEADELAQLPSLERQRETYKRVRERGLESMKAAADAARASHEPAAVPPQPIATVIDNNQPGWTNIIETAPNVTLPVGTKLYDQSALFAVGCGVADEIWRRESSAPTPSAWQPIETADPNTKALLFSPARNLSNHPQQEDDIRVSAPRDFTWATHWAPIPKPPHRCATEGHVTVQPPAPDDARDAARYRWLRNQRRWYANTPPAPGVNIKFEYLIADNGERLDEVIDAARLSSTKASE